MGFDFLGTLNRSQFDVLSGFIFSIQQLVLEKHSPEDEFSIYVKHLQAELSKANLIYMQLEHAVQDFSGFMGDDQILKGRIDTSGVNMRVKNRLDDGDTAYNVDRLKNPVRQIIKRKKDNLEYRIKKYYDLIDQLELKVAYFLDYVQTSDNFLNGVVEHFGDNLHAHNVSEEDRRTADGLVQHVPTTLVIDNKNSNLVEQEASSYIDPRKM